MPKHTRLQFRTTEEKKQRFERCCAKVGLDQTALGQAAVDALCDYIEASGEITLPLRVLPKSALAALEKKAEYSLMARATASTPRSLDEESAVPSKPKPTPPPGCVRATRPLIKEAARRNRSAE